MYVGNISHRQLLWKKWRRCKHDILFLKCFKNWSALRTKYSHIEWLIFSSLPTLKMTRMGSCSQHQIFLISTTMHFIYAIGIPWRCIFTHNVENLTRLSQHHSQCMHKYDTNTYNGRWVISFAPFIWQAGDTRWQTLGSFNISNFIQHVTGHVITYPCRN